MNGGLENFQVQTNSKPHRTYLVTYSQADRTKFLSRQSFGEAVKNEFNLGDPKGKVAYCSCALENHANGGEHYHLSLKLTGPLRWLSVRNALQRLHNINVNFSDSHENYYTAYKYMCKSVESVSHSDEHPDLREIGSPKTKHCMKACQRKHKLKKTTTSQEK